MLAVWTYLSPRLSGDDSPEMRKLRAAFRALRADPEAIAYGVVIFLAVAVLFMSSFFTNPAGIRTAFVEAFTIWRDIHGTQRVNQPWFFYLMFLAVYEVFRGCLRAGGPLANRPQAERLYDNVAVLGGCFHLHLFGGG